MEATGDFYQQNLKGVQARGVKGYLQPDTGNFIFIWKNAGWWKMAVTSNQGKQLKCGYVKANSKSWLDQKTWASVQTKNFFYIIKNFQGTGEGSYIFDLSISNITMFL